MSIKIQKPVCLGMFIAFVSIRGVAAEDGWGSDDGWGSGAGWGSTVDSGSDAGWDTNAPSINSITARAIESGGAENGKAQQYCSEREKAVTSLIQRAQSQEKQIDSAVRKVKAQRQALAAVLEEYRVLESTLFNEEFLKPGQAEKVLQNPVGLSSSTKSLSRRLRESVSGLANGLETIAKSERKLAAVLDEAEQYKQPRKGWRCNQASEQEGAVGW